MSGLPSFDAAEAMCEMWGHPTDHEGWCACGENHPTPAPSARDVGEQR